MEVSISNINATFCFFAVRCGKCWDNRICYRHFPHKKVKLSGPPNLS